jgi:hypothetical protein
MSVRFPLPGRPREPDQVVLGERVSQEGAVDQVAGDVAGHVEPGVVDFGPDEPASA